MANVKTEVPTEERVTIRLFKDNAKYKDDVFVAVNGRSFLIQRGVDIEVPRCVAQVLEDSMEQDAKTAELMEREAGYFMEESKKLGV